MSQSDQILRQRVRTAVIFTAIVLALVLSGVVTVIAFLTTIGLGCAYEYGKMSKEKNGVIWSITGGVLGVVCGLFLATDDGLLVLSNYVSIAMCLVLFLNLFLGFIDFKKWLFPISLFLFGLNLGNVSGVIWLGNVEYIFVFYTILMIWINDTFAYLIGRKLGKNKLFKRISPNKTWEGFFGGMLMTLVLGYVLYRVTGIFGLSTWIYFGLMISIFGTLGDLVESSIKRYFDVKDSGNILPGHGGFYDRFDSFIYVLPIVVFIILHNNF